MRAKGLYILDAGNFGKIYGEAEQADIAAMVDIYAPPQTKLSVAENPTLLEPCEIIFSGWGAPRIDAAFLASAPHLRAIFYGAGSVRDLLTEAMWDRGIVLTSSWGANGLPVAEYTLSQILFCLKLGWRYVTSIQRDKRYPRKGSVPGGYGSTVAIISLGMIGRLVANLLKPFDLKVIAYDPFVGADDAASLGVDLCSLDECFARADVVSLHTPWLAETVGMITAAHFRLMKPDASFINTSRGAVVDEPGMISVLEERPDVTAVLDVTYPEPPVQGSKLYALPNVILTPHIAGSMGNECRRMGRYAVEECSRYVRGEPLQWQVTREQAATLA